jgi:hypothetical protein
MLHNYQYAKIFLASHYIHKKTNKKNLFLKRYHFTARRARYDISLLAFREAAEDTQLRITHFKIKKFRMKDGWDSLIPSAAMRALSAFRSVG